MFSFDVHVSIRNRTIPGWNSPGSALPYYFSFKTDLSFLFKNWYTLMEYVLPEKLFYKIKKILNGFLTLFLLHDSDEFIKSWGVCEEDIPIFLFLSNRFLFKIE